MPMQVQVVEIDLDPDTCRAEAEEAVTLLDSFNDQLANAHDVSDLTTPSPGACRWCQFKAICPAFWTDVNEEWAEELASAAVCGVLKESPTLIQDGQAWSLSVEVTTGTVPATEVTIAPLDKDVHDLGQFQLVGGIRLVNLYHRNACPL